MPVNFASINGEKSATVTFRVETVTIDHNSTVVHREILVLGSPQTSNALTAVVAAAPTSTEFGAVVRIASGPSSAADLLMRPVFSSTSADNPVSISDNSTVVVSAFAAGLISSAAPAGNSSALVVRVAGGPSSAADFLVRPVFSSTSTDNPVRAVLSSTAADNPVVVSGNSTVVVSAFAAALISSAAPAGNSSALVVRVAGGPSSAGDFLMRPVFSSTNTDNPVRAVLSSTAADNPVVVSGNSTVVVSAFAAGLISTATPAAGSSGLNVWNVGGVLSSLAGIVAVRPSDTNFASSAGFHFDSSGALQVAASFTGSTIVTVAAFGAGLLSSAAVGANSSALNVRVVGHGSSAADFPVQVSGNSTVVVSAFAAGLISTAAAGANSSALNVRVVGHGSSAVDFPVRALLSSTAADNPVLVSGNSTVVISGFAAGLISTTSPSSNSSGQTVWQALPDLKTAASSNAFASTLVVINSTAAGLKCKVFAYSITTTNAGPGVVKFYKGSSMIWPVTLAAVSGAISGVNLAVSPPAYLFQSAAGSSVTMRLASSAAGWKTAVSYFMAP